MTGGGRSPYEQLAAFVSDVGLGARLRDFGYREAHMEIIVRETRRSAQYRFNPRETSEDDLIRLVQQLI